MAAGQRPINNVVDITNFVMLLTGHPLHAFDLDRVAGRRLVVRPAHTGERIELLDGAVRELEPPMVVILDDDGPTSLAGIMGGSRSEVSEATTRVLMEVASWNGPNIQRTSRKLGAAQRGLVAVREGPVARGCAGGPGDGLDPDGARVGATLAPGTIDVGGPGPDPARFALRPARVAALLGIDIPAERCAEILEALGFGVSGVDGEALAVTVPHWRRLDVTREIDLVEEVARVDGLERLPATLPGPARRLRRAAPRPAAAPRRRGRAGRARAVRDRGLELRLAPSCPTGCGWPPTTRGAGWSRWPTRCPRRSRPCARRCSGSLLDGARNNRPRRGDVRVDSGRSVRAAGVAAEATSATAAARARAAPTPSAHAATLPTERLAAPARARRGRRRGATPEPPPADFFAAKGVLEALRTALRVPLAFGRGRDQPFLNPARAARGAGRRRAPVGWIGELHPPWRAAWELPGAAASRSTSTRCSRSARPRRPTRT